MGSQDHRGLKKSLWTFQVRGGDAFSIDVAGNPSVSHDGRLSIWHLVLDHQGAEGLGAIVAEKGCRVARHTDSESPEQLAERQRFLEIQSADTVFPCLKCPECFWLDMQAPELCGLDAWNRVAIDDALRSDEKARGDAESCPAR